MQALDTIKRVVVEGRKAGLVASNEVISSACCNVRSMSSRAFQQPPARVRVKLEFPYLACKNDLLTLKIHHHLGRRICLSQVPERLDVFVRKR